MNKSHILIVDDDEKMRGLLGQYLQANGFMTTEARDTREARLALDTFVFDLILLDIMLPEESGIEFAKKLREIPSNLAILMLTAMEDAKSRVLGLKAGADDYLSKPFEPEELILRIKKLIQRSNEIQGSRDLICFGEIKYDVKRNIFLKGAKATRATSSEQTLMDLLLNSNGQVIDRDDLARALKVNARSVDVQIKRLRNKLEDGEDKPVFLKSVRGRGYILYNDN